MIKIKYNPINSDTFYSNSVLLKEMECKQTQKFSSETVLFLFVVALILCDVTKDNILTSHVRQLICVQFQCLVFHNIDT